MTSTPREQLLSVLPEGFVIDEESEPDLNVTRYGGVGFLVLDPMEEPTPETLIVGLPEKWVRLIRDCRTLTGGTWWTRAWWQPSSGGWVRRGLICFEDDEAHARRQHSNIPLGGML